MDQEGQEYRLTPDSEPILEAETSGPQRTTVRALAGYEGPGGERLARAVLRLTYGAGFRGVRIHHVLIPDADPARYRIRALGLRLPGPVDAGEVRVAGEQDGREVLHAGGPFRCLQDRDDRFAVTGAVEAVGRRSGTWACVCSRKEAMACLIRHGWEKYPTALVWDGRQLDVQLWPAEGCASLDLSAIPGPIVNATTEAELRAELARHPQAAVSLYRYVSRGQTDWKVGNVVPLMREARRLEADLLPGRFAHYYRVFGQDGRGTGLSHEITVADLPVDASEPELADLAVHVRTPPILSADPEWNCATGAFGPAAPFGRTPFGNVDRMATWGEWAVYEDFVERLRLYGARDWGDYVNGNPAMGGPLWHVYGSQDPVRITDRIGWNNTESHDSTVGPWVQFLRTGDPRLLRGAERMTEHFATVDQRHAFSGPREHRAITQYHTLRHYDGGDCPSHTLSSGLLLGYYVTGNRAWRDVALAQARHFLAVQEKDGSGWYDPSRDPSRQTTGPLTCVLNAYTLTWDAKYRDSIHRFLEAWTPVHDVRRHYMGGTLGYAGAEYASLVADEPFRAAFKKAMDDMRDLMALDGNSVYYLPGMVWLWEQTGDPTYLAYCHFCLLWHDHNLRRNGASDMVGRSVLGFPEFSYGFVAGHLAAGLAGLEKARGAGVDMPAALEALRQRRAAAQGVAPRDALFYATDAVHSGDRGRWEP